MSGPPNGGLGWGLSAILTVARGLDWPKSTAAPKHPPMTKYTFGHQVDAPDIVVVEVGGFMRSLSIEQAEAMAADLDETAAQCRRACAS